MRTTETAILAPPRRDADFDKWDTAAERVALTWRDVAASWIVALTLLTGVAGAYLTVPRLGPGSVIASAAPGPAAMDCGTS